MRHFRVVAVLFLLLVGYTSASAEDLRTFQINGTFTNGVTVTGTVTFNACNPNVPGCDDLAGLAGTLNTSDGRTFHTGWGMGWAYDFTLPGVPMTNFYIDLGSPSGDQYYYMFIQLHFPGDPTYFNGGPLCSLDNPCYAKDSPDLVYQQYSNWYYSPNLAMQSGTATLVSENTGVPEPASVFLLGSCMLILSRRKRMQGAGWFR